jgi:hypothetical protein
MDANLLSSAESLFLQAEAVERGYITGNPKHFLMQVRVTASFVITGLTAAAGYNLPGGSSLYVDASATYLLTSTNKIEMLMMYTIQFKMDFIKRLC